MSSPIQRRNRIDSARHLGTFFLWAGAILAVLWIAFAIWQGFRVFMLVELALAVSFIAQGLGRLRAATKAQTALEAEHGPGAGKQEPV